jgi:hypothetical protein
LWEITPRAALMIDPEWMTGYAEVIQVKPSCRSQERSGRMETTSTNPKPMPIWLPFYNA